ncbi:probable glutathione S-transferase GSTU6 isoform X1 [Miscanthus floridulus]|uniref:probable glutathione S-transferase GSTU6 isoform X1 n=1 Tax=Miscanthus floridulus TaxID=154761 RepID=UPI003458F2AB
MAAEELTLLGLWASPFVIRARIALNLKGLTYVYAEDSIYNKSELLLKSNPVLKKVPVLIHDGKPVCESQVIVQYIDEAFPAAAGAPILPSAPYDRAVARFWASYVEDKWFSTWLPVFSGRTAEERVEAATQVVAVLQTLEQAFKECSKGKAFFGGDTVGLVDVVLGGHLGWLYATEAICGVKVVDATKTPLLVAWAERFCALDAVKGLIPDVDRLVEYNKTRRAALGLPLLLPYAELQQ